MEYNGIDQEIEKKLNDLNLGISELDDQHQAFFLHMVGLRRALIDGSGGREKLMKTLRFLDSFVIEHFSSEEKYMRRYNYPGILVHKADHDAFAATIAEFKTKALDLDARGEVTSFLAIEVTRRLEKWLEDHIRALDRKMAAFLVEKM
jgi:hemerythrin